MRYNRPDYIYYDDDKIYQCGIALDGLVIKQSDQYRCYYCTGSMCI